MADRIKGITVEIGGNTTGLSKALGGVNKDIRDTQSQLKDVERLLKLDPTNTELLAQKQRLLSRAVEETKTKLEALKEAEKQVQQQVQRGEASQEQYDALQREIIATEQSLRNLETQAEKSNAAIVKIEATADKIATASGNIAKATAPLTAGIVAAGTIAFNKASEIQDALGATRQVFGEQADSMEQWADSLESYYGIAKGEALTYANTMGSMLKNIGNLTEEEAAAQSQTLIKLAGDLTAMFGGSTADAVYALTGALKGNNTMLDNYGMAVNENLIKTKAFEMGLISEGQQVDLASKQAATLALIMEQAADATGQAAREADGASGSMRETKTEISNITAELGENLLPMITPLIQKVSEFVKWISNLDEENKQLLVTLLLVVAAISPVAGIISAIATIISVVTTAMTALNAVMAANPAGVLCLAFVALIAIIQQLWTHSESFRAFWLEIWGNITTAFDEAVVWIGNGVDNIALFFSNLWNGIINGAKNCFNMLINSVNKMISTALGPLNLLIEAANIIPGVNIPKLKFAIPNIPMLADGGTVLRGSAIVGDGGPELLTVSPYGTKVTPLTNNGGTKTAGGTYNVQFVIQGYTADESQHIADIVNRELGRVYG